MRKVDKHSGTGSTLCLGRTQGNHIEVFPRFLEVHKTTIQTYIVSIGYSDTDFSKLIHRINNSSLGEQASAGRYDRFPHTTKKLLFQKWQQITVEFTASPNFLLQYPWIARVHPPVGAVRLMG